ncbi:MAG TPA: HD domain-containing protein [Baekduia sp.]
MSTARPTTIAGVRIPDSALARDATQLVGDISTPLLFAHSRRVFLWGSLEGTRRRLEHDPELLYVGSMFHDVGLLEGHRSADERFEVDGANEARRFLESRGLSEEQVMTVWLAIALHTTPGVTDYLQPEVRLVQFGAGYDVVGRNYDHVPAELRDEVLAAHPRTGFKDGIVDAFYDGIKDKPLTAYGTMNSDILEAKDPSYVGPNMCALIRGSFAE